VLRRSREEQTAEGRRQEADSRRQEAVAIATADSVSESLFVYDLATPVP
jgi:hypothetical protein